MSCTHTNKDTCGCSDKALTTSSNYSYTGENCPDGEECEELYNADCITYTGEDLGCNGEIFWTTGDRLPVFLTNLLDYFCALTVPIITAQNLGAGEGEVYESKDSVNNIFFFRTIKAGTGITVTQSATEILIDATGADYIDDVSLTGSTLTFTRVGSLAFAGSIDLSGVGSTANIYNIDSTILADTVANKRLVDGGNVSTRWFNLANDSGVHSLGGMTFTNYATDSYTNDSLFSLKGGKDATADTFTNVILSVNAREGDYKWINLFDDGLGGADSDKKLVFGDDSLQIQKSIDFIKNYPTEVGDGPADYIQSRIGFGKDSEAYTDASLISSRKNIWSVNSESLFFWNGINNAKVLIDSEKGSEYQWDNGSGGLVEKYIRSPYFEMTSGAAGPGSTDTWNDGSTINPSSTIELGKIMLATWGDSYVFLPNGYTQNSQDASAYDSDYDFNFGVGTMTPDAKLHVMGSTSNTAAYALRIEDSIGGNLFNIRNDGNIGINMDPGGQLVQIQSRGVSTTALSLKSDTGGGEIIKLRENAVGDGEFFVSDHTFTSRVTISSANTAFGGATEYTDTSIKITSKDDTMTTNKERSFYIMNNVTLGVDAPENYKLSLGSSVSNEMLGLYGNGNIVIDPSSHISTGELMLLNIPTVATATVGSIWNDAGTLKIVT